MLEPGAWRKRLAALPPGEREATLTESLRADVAAVLGYPHADALPAGKYLADLGFDSLTAVQIRNRLSMALKLRLSAAVVFEHRTAEELARHLLGLLDGEPAAVAAPDATRAAEGAGATRPERPAYTLSSLFRSVSAAGQPVAAMHLLVTASWALPTFSAAEGREHALPPIRRSPGRSGSGSGSGSGRPIVVYFPAYHPSLTSDGGDFPRFHRALQDGPEALEVLEFPHPGIGAGASVPQNLAAGRERAAVRRGPALRGRRTVGGRQCGAPGGASAGDHGPGTDRSGAAGHVPHHAGQQRQGLAAVPGRSTAAGHRTSPLHR
jgi:hypothetical protein